MFVLLNIIVYVVLGTFTLAGLPWADIVAAGQRGGATNNSPPGPLFWIGFCLLLLWLLVTLIPNLALHVRRFHDQDKSGWFYLLNFIPYIGGFVVLVFMCMDGTAGPNQYGPDPKGGSGVGDIFN